MSDRLTEEIVSILAHDEGKCDDIGCDICYRHLRSLAEEVQERRKLDGLAPPGVPLERWVQMLTDALRDMQPDKYGMWASANRLRSTVLALADSVTPKENE